VCGQSPTVTDLVDYEAFCAVTELHGAAMASGALTAAAGVAVPQISARELADLLSGGDTPGVLLVDVRGAQEREINGIPAARAIHLDEFRSGAAVRQIPFDRPVVIFCRAGVRSQEASRLLMESGHPDVRTLAGGVLAWVRDVDPAQPGY
jgi:adenylyltransferase/sulfurtransferase